MLVTSLKETDGCNGCCYISSVEKDGIIKCKKPFQKCEGIIFIEEPDVDITPKLSEVLIGKEFSNERK